MNFSHALCALFNFGVSVQRQGWMNQDWHLTTCNFGHGPELRRVGPDGVNLPWGPTEADLLADDWISETTATEPYVTEGSFGFALEAAKQGKTVGFGKIRMTLETDREHVQFLRSQFPNGQVGIFRPQLQDLLRNDWIVQE